MRIRTFVMSVAAISIGFLILTAPEILAFSVMLLGAIALWRMRPRSGVRR
ncbi:hypothetical protein [Nocardia sp. X0981]